MNRRPPKSTLLPYTTLFRAWWSSWSTTASRCPSRAAATGRSPRSSTRCARWTSTSGCSTTPSTPCPPAATPAPRPTSSAPSATACCGAWASTRTSSPRRCAGPFRRGTGRSGGRRTAPMPQLTPYLTVRDARSATAWYAEALGAHVVGEPSVMDDDRIGHAELDLGGARLYLADEYRELGLAAPDPGRVSVTLHLAVPDADAAVDRAAAAGATVERQPADGPEGRTGAVVR